MNDPIVMELIAVPLNYLRLKKKFSKHFIMVTISLNVLILGLNTGSERLVWRVWIKTLLTSVLQTILSMSVRGKTPLQI